MLGDKLQVQLIKKPYRKKKESNLTAGLATFLVGSNRIHLILFKIIRFASKNLRSIDFHKK